MKTKHLLLIALSLFASLAFGQLKKARQPQKVVIMSGVELMPTWIDSVKVDSFYNFQLTGHKGKIANMKLKLTSGVLEDLQDNKYRVKIHSNDKALELKISKYNPMTKEANEIKVITVPATK